MKFDLHVSEYSDDQFEPMSELLRSHFPASDRLLTKAYTNWLYVDNPFGRALLVRALDGAQWVAFLAMIPVELSANGRTARTYFVVNVLVHPEFQGKHLFSRLITVAKDRAFSEEAALMGHPNAAALPAWKRARMVFHEDLRPSLALSWPLGKMRTRRIASKADLEGADSLLAEVAGDSPGWRVRATAEYLAWRYLQHPSNTYSLQLLHLDGEVQGVQVTRPIKPLLHLLVDTFVRRQHWKAATRKLPLATVCFWPDSGLPPRQSAALPLPWRKRLPIFFTPGPNVDVTGGIVELGLSPSDF